MPEEAYEKKYQYSFTVSEELNARIEKCKTLLSGKHPKGLDLETLVDELTELFLDRKDPERRAKRRKKREKKLTPKIEKPEETSRYIKPATRDAVYNRDGGRCAYVGSNGKRCDSTWDLEIHHDGTAFALGGEHDIKNLKLLCAAHNRLEAERVFGRDHMQRYGKNEKKNIRQKE